MFKSLKRDNLSTYSKYQVGVTATRMEDSTLLNSGGFISILRRGGKSIIAAITVLMILMVMLLGSIASAPKANAGMMEDIQNGVARAICNNGAFGLDSVDKNFLSPNTPPNGTTPTMFEKYGFSGTSFTSWAGFEVEDNTLTANKNEGIGTSVGIISALGGNSRDAGLADWEPYLEKNTLSGLNNTRNLCGALTNTAGIGTAIGNIFLEATKAVVWAGNVGFEASSNLSSSLFKYFKTPLEKIGDVLWSKLFFDFLTPMIMIGALYLGWVGFVKRQSTRFWQSLAWIIAVVVFAGISWGNPLKISQTVSSVSSGISSGVASVITGGLSDDTGLCAPKGKDVAVRQFQCNNYYNNVYSPWVQGQFGKTPKQLTELKDDKAFLASVGKQDTGGKHPMPTLKDTRNNQMNINKVFLGNTVPSEQNWALYYLDYRSNWDNASAEQKLNKNRSQMHVIAHELSDPNLNRSFRGDNGGSRGWIGFIALLSAIFSNLLIIVIGVSIIMLDLRIMILGVFTPIFALAALHAGEGRTKAIEFFGKMLSFGIQKILLGIYLSVFVVIMNTFAGWTGAGTNAGIQLIAVVAIGILGFVMKNEIVSSLSNWSLFGASAGGQKGSGKPSLGKKLMSHAGAGLLGGALVAGKGIAGGMGSKSALEGVKKEASVGAGKAPQDKAGLGLNKAGLAGKAPQDKKRGADENIKNPQHENHEESANHDDSGAGTAPQQPYEADDKNEYAKDSYRNEHEDFGTAYADNSGSGEAPQAGTQESDTNNETPQPVSRRQMKREVKAQEKAIQQELKDNGYRNHVGLGTILKATAKTTAIGLATGNMNRAVSAGTSTVARKKEAIKRVNEGVVKNVTQKHRDRNYELARQQRQSEFEKAQEKRKAEREANQKRFAEERANRTKTRGSYEQHSNTTQHESKGKAPQQPNNEASSLKVSKPANQTQAPPAPKVTPPTPPAPKAPVRDEKVEAPRVTAPAPQPVREARNENPRVEQLRNPAPQPVRETPRVETPRNTTPAPQVSNPANYASEVQAPRVEQPRNTTPAPQPVEKPKYSPKVAPQPVRETPKVETPRNATPAPQPVEKPRKSTPAPKPVVKESKPKVSNPKPPAPPVKAPAPKAKVNPPKAQAPQPPLPSRKSLRESGNQTPPAPKPPQPRNR